MLFGLNPSLLKMHTPQTAHTIIFVIVSVALACLLAGSLWEWRRTGRPTMTLLILGGGFCCLNESLVDLLGRCYFPTHGGVMGQTLLGRTVPVWVDIAYAIFFGAFPYFLALLLQRGTSRRSMWMAIGAFWVANSILELPLLSTNLYVYYGEQPFKVAHFPLVWLTINVLGAFLAAVVAVRGAAFFQGRRRLLLLLVPFACYMASWVVDMPAFWALNSNVATWVKWCGVGAAIVLGVLAIDALIRLGRSGADAADQDDHQSAARTAGDALELQPA
jgi:hypothetical protein